MKTPMYVRVCAVVASAAAGSAFADAGKGNHRPSSNGPTLPPTMSDVFGSGGGGASGPQSGRGGGGYFSSQLMAGGSPAPGAHPGGIAPTPVYGPPVVPLPQAFMSGLTGLTILGLVSRFRGRLNAK